MDPIFPLPGHVMPASPAPPPAVGGAPACWPRPGDRLDRLGSLGPDDKTAGLARLAVHYPAVCDGMLAALEKDDAMDIDNLIEVADGSIVNFPC